MIKSKTFLEVRNWIYRNAREIELSLWRYYFENGKKEDVLCALSAYQNEDGGFGHALEADNWNPNSSPYTTLFAINILKDIEYTDLEHPIYKGIMNYLNSQKDFAEYGWRFTILTNDDYPHAPWWNFSEEANRLESIGLTAELCAFVLRHGDKDSMLYKNVTEIANILIERMMNDNSFGDMGIGGFIVLVDTIKILELREYNYDSLQNRLNDLVKNSIEHDVSKWKVYGVRPSNYITHPCSIFYKENEMIVHKELEYLIETKPKNDVWGITWTWFENTDKYYKEFAISENWWKAYKAIEKLRFLKNFDSL
ncbi:MULTISPECIES: hypothetical protein [unclassified Clostridium]|uniref:hypothetical protein n=1 Tax=unclassified Clostridium TaxID=2614128 RepID=UPI00029834FF|nr:MULTISPECIES: hypothetical protein [unclassified Clostridium]EKQ56050.1 MAG: hypothetical protein A370_02272 [Clostridium sp. Maddingley MBC34-26]